MVGTRIRELREEKEISQKVLAEIIGVSPSTIGMYEQNRRNPDSEMLKSLADYFDVSVDYILGRTSLRNPQQTSTLKKKEVETIAAHLDDKNITPKKMKMIQDYIDLLFDDEE